MIYGGNYIDVRASAVDQAVFIGRADKSLGDLDEGAAFSRSPVYVVSGQYAPRAEPWHTPIATDPARYSGHVDGSTMSLTVRAGKETSDAFTLSRGTQPSLRFSSSRA